MSERLDKGLQALKGQLDAKTNAFFSSCISCGICAESCLFYTETKDPRYTPIYKTEPLRKVWKAEKTFWGKFSKILGFANTLTEDDLANWEELVYDGCTSCGRCSMVCPVGIDVADMIYRVKQGLEASGYSPQDLVAAADRAIEFGSPMGDIFPALKAHIKHIEADTGLKVPIDIEGADYMATISANEIVTYPEYIASLTRIFHEADVSWTISSETFQATNSGLQLGDNEIAGTLVQRIVDAAEKLKVKNVVSPECGHAYAAIRWNGPNFIGRKYNFEVVHILELLDQLYRDGRLKTSGMDTSKVTFHDPCQLVRRGGVDAEPRELLGSVANNVIEMKEHGRMNWCCGGGGGVSAIERAADLRITVFNRKKAQLDELDIETMVTACSNCRAVLEDGLDANEMDLPVVGLTEMIAEYLLESKPTDSSQEQTEPHSAFTEGESNSASRDAELNDLSTSTAAGIIKTTNADNNCVEVETDPDQIAETESLVSPASQTSTGKSDFPKDNLKKIDGIGPKTEALLNAAGISTYKQLSQFDNEALNAFIADADSPYLYPDTWPKQAQLANAGKWDDLSHYQDSLLRSG